MSNAFSLTTMFVAANGTLASSGSTQDLAPQAIGLFRPDYSIANAGNIAAAKYFYIAQGRKENVPGLGSKRTDKISTAGVVEWYKVVAEDTAANQISSFGNFHFKCDDNIIFTFRVNSNLTDIGFYNGYTKSVIVKAPCCDCNGSPCDDISGANTQALVDAAVAQLNATGADQYNGADVRLSNFLSFQRTGTGANSALLVSGKPQPTASPLASDINGNQYDTDRIWFRGWVRPGTDTTADFYVDDSCNVIATSTVLQRATYPTGSSAEIKLMEIRYYSYQTSHFKHLHKNPDFNGAFSSYVTDGTFYDTYYIVSREPSFDSHSAWSDKVPQDFTVIVAFPTGTGTTFETALTAALGAPTNVSMTDVATTTTTSTTSTTTTSTTTLQP